MINERDTIRQAYGDFGELNDLDEDDNAEYAPDTGPNTYIPALQGALKHIEEALDAARKFDKSNR
jgi:hypothetical protein